MASGSTSRALVLLLLASGFLITGLLFDYMPMIVDDQIKRQVELATNDEIRSFWSRPPVDFHSYYWLYEVLNAEQFLGGDRVRVRKVGPYQFTSRVEKRIIGLSANKYRIVYNTTRHFHIDESLGAPLANAQLDEPLTLLNPIYASMVGGARAVAATLDPSMRSTVAPGVNRLTERYNETLVRNTTAREALLGRRLPIIERAKKMAETFGLDLKMGDIGADNVFGYVAVMNSTWSGPFEIYTGYGASTSSLGDLISYKGKRRLTEYQGRCNRLQTSAGELRPMPIGPNQTLEMFMPSMCRILHLKPTGTRKMREGLAFSYVVAPEDFMSADLNPDNRCFCLNGTNDNYCSLNGAIELGPCSYYAPIVLAVSNIELDARITGSVADWEPELIDSGFDIRPAPNRTSQMLVLRRIGVPIQADITLIMFMKVIRDPTFRQTGSVPEVSYVPLLMVREVITIPPKLAQIIVNLESFLALTYHIKVVMYLSAIVLLCWLTGHYYGRFSARRADRVVPRGCNRGGAGDSSIPGPDGTAGPGGGGGGADNKAAATATAAAADSLWSPRQPSGNLAGDSISERANSADSNRSQPPSRTSRIGSLEGVTTGGSADSGKLEETTAAGEVDEAQSKRMAKIFSKVDEELQLKTDKLVSLGQLASSDKKTTAEMDGANETADTSANGRPGAGACEHRRRNWFVKGWSNFVRMLSGIRSTITDASQLDLSENDYQDKRLEMLAGKIDNWYSDQLTEAPSGDQSPVSASVAVALPAPTEAGASACAESEQAAKPEAGREAGEAPRQVEAVPSSNVDADARGASGETIRRHKRGTREETEPDGGAGDKQDASEVSPAGGHASSGDEPAARKATGAPGEDQLSNVNTTNGSVNGANNGADTSGDDELSSLQGGGSPVSSEDKALAFERMELALSKQVDAGPNRAGDGSGDKQNSGDGRQGEHEEARPLAESGSMSTGASIDSVVVIAPANQAQLESDELARDGGANEPAGEQQQRQQTSNQSGGDSSKPAAELASKSSQPPDESSSQLSAKPRDADERRQSGALKQSNKWQASEQVEDQEAAEKEEEGERESAGQREAAPAKSGDDKPADKPSEQRAGLNATAGNNSEQRIMGAVRPVVRQAATSEASETSEAASQQRQQPKDERRDSGVKLDSRNGIDQQQQQPVVSLAPGQLQSAEVKQADDGDEDGQGRERAPDEQKERAEDETDDGNSREPQQQASAADQKRQIKSIAAS